MKTIYKNFGIEIVTADKKYYLRYDAGEIVVEVHEIEITQGEVNDVQKCSNSKEVYQCLLKILKNYEKN